MYGAPDDLDEEDYYDEELPYCNACGNEDLEFLCLYANGAHYRCKQCKHKFVY